MATLWEHDARGNHYQVRNAGRSVRLYTNGLFHSQFNPGQPVSGGVWDLLFVPAFFRPPGAVRRVLMLGVGGGAVIRQLQHFVRPAEIVGVELDPVHLRIARRFFGVGRRGVRLVRADAREWLAGYDGPPFDMVIDDLFGGRDGDPVRAVAADADWMATLGRMVAPDGVLVMNFAGPHELRRCAVLTDAVAAAPFETAFRFTLPHYENVIAAFLGTKSSHGELLNHLARERGLDLSRRSCRLRFALRRVVLP